MVFGFDHNSVATLYTRRFYLASCFLNAVCMASAMLLLDSPGREYGAVWLAIDLALVVEFLVRPGGLDRERLRFRYVVKLLSGMGAISLGTVLIDRDYVLYIPAVMGMMYLNVNTLLRSPLLQKGIYGFMGLSVAQSVAMHHDGLGELVEYGATSTLLVASALLTFELFRSNKGVFERNERRVSVLMEVGRMQNELLVHDVNNALMSVYVLSNEKYRLDKALFVEELERRLEQVRELLEARILDRREEVDLGDLLDRMPAASGDCLVVREFEDGVPLLANRNMLYSMLRNFLENSAEAAVRVGRRCTIRVRKSGNLVAIEDDAGGFDTGRVRSGTTSKESAEGHGVFLRTVSDPVVQAGFGYRLEISRTSTGTRVEIRFGEVPAIDGGGSEA